MSKKLLDKIHAQKFLISTLEMVNSVQLARIDQFKAAGKDLLTEIHEDIFEKEPRGQVAVGQDVRWHRCKKLLKGQ